MEQSGENQRTQQIFKEQYRESSVFCEPAPSSAAPASATRDKRANEGSPAVAVGPQPHPKRARIGSAIHLVDTAAQAHAAAIAATGHVSAEPQKVATQANPENFTTSSGMVVPKSITPHLPEERVPLRKFRSKSMPSLHLGKFAARKQKRLAPAVHVSRAPQLPPINAHSLKEIDLQEIVKNPQLRHDIVFDPQLQFRPNLDGERGRKKKSVVHKYWRSIEMELQQYTRQPEVFEASTSRLVTLFVTLREILVGLLPPKETESVQEALDTEMIVQNLLKGSLDMIQMSVWLAGLFKAHCAPMRDPWVDEMTAKFERASTSGNVGDLVDGLRWVFTILEAMKLDIANHQIRVLRPALVSNAVEFEQEYFKNLILNEKLDLQSAFSWFRANYAESSKSSDKLCAKDAHQACVEGVLKLLSCRTMAREYPVSLTFDHSRLVLLRADIRQIVCLQICVLLYKQLVAQDSGCAESKKQKLSAEAVNQLKQEVISIITDDNGNVKWTKNIQSIALHMCHRALTCATAEKQEFAYSWLIKQTQPSSDIYAIMEKRVFEKLKQFVVAKNEAGDNVICVQDSTDIKSGKDEFDNVSKHLSTVVNFHWKVFGSYYMDSIM